MTPKEELHQAIQQLHQNDLELMKARHPKLQLQPWQHQNQLKHQEMHLRVRSTLKRQTLLQLAKISRKVEEEGNEGDEEGEVGEEEEIVEVGEVGILGKERAT